MAELTDNDELDLWHASHQEPVIDPELPIIDPHHHLWSGENVNAAAPYLLDEFTRDLRCGHNIVRTVFVECDEKHRKIGAKELRPVGETEYVVGITRNPIAGPRGPIRVAAGIVGAADLTAGEKLRSVLDAHREAGDGRLRGIRHRTMWWPKSGNPDDEDDPAKGVMDSEAFRSGAELLGKLDLSLDTWLVHWQLPEVIRLAGKTPDTLIILNHIAVPVGVDAYAGHRDEVFTEWKANMTTLSGHDNVLVKLGGVGMDFVGFGWDDREHPPAGSEQIAQTIAPYFLHCIECFGVDRCMFESNFPVDKSSYSYRVMWNVFKRVSGDLSDTERAALFHDTAAQAYRLVDDPLTGRG